MNYKKAIQVAVEAMQKEKQKYAFDANLARKFKSDQPAHQNALKKVTEIDQAINLLQQPRMF